MLMPPIDSRKTDMDGEKAKIILSSRYGGQADVSDEELCAALELARRNAELGQWLAEEEALDNLMGQAIASIQPPAHLKSAILASAPAAIVPGRTRMRREVYGFLALAAAVTVLIGGVVHRFTEPGLIEASVLTARIEALKKELPGALGETNPDVRHLREWLAGHGGVPDFDLPSSLAGKDTVGCQVFSVNGNIVTLVCFHLDDKRVVHYLVMDRKRMANPPPLGHPVFLQENGTSFAMWSDQEHSYVLAEFGDENRLGQLL